jgi:hypothetical protein
MISTIIQFFQMKKCCHRENFLSWKQKYIGIRYQTEHSFKWKWQKSFAGSWQHLLGTKKKNNENGIPSLKFFYYFFSTRLLSTTSAMLVCTVFVLQSPLLSRGLCHYYTIFKRFWCMQLKFGGRGLKLPWCRRRALCPRWRPLRERRAAPRYPPTPSPADIEHPRGVQNSSYL